MKNAAFSAQSIQRIIDTELRPLVNVDGGDIRFASLEGTTVRVIASAACAGCPKCDDDFAWWIARELNRRTGNTFDVTLDVEHTYYHH